MEQVVSGKRSAHICDPLRIYKGILSAARASEMPLTHSFNDRLHNALAPPFPTKNLYPFAIYVTQAGPERARQLGAPVRPVQVQAGPELAALIFFKNGTRGAPNQHSRCR